MKVSLAGAEKSGRSELCRQLFCTFVDEYMVEARGDFVKVYLFLLRIAEEDAEGFQFSDLCDALDETENKVERAFSFWEEAGLICVNREGGVVSEVVLMTSEADEELPVRTEQTRTAQQTSQTAQALAGQTSTRQAQAEERSRHDEVMREEGFRNLVHEFSVYTENGLSSTQFERLVYLYDKLGMNYDVLNYLLELCVDRAQRKGKRYLESFRYFEKIALDWHEKGITTVEEARREGSLNGPEYYEIMKEDGIPTGNRTVNQYQKEFMDRWLYEYGFSMNLIREAIRRTFRQTKSQDANYEYTNGILSGWHQAGVKSIEDIRALDEAHRAKSESEKAARDKDPKTQVPKGSYSNSFHNFKQREYNYDALMEAIRRKNRED